LDQTNDRVRALEAGADDYMTKPVDRVELVARVRSALRLKGVYDSLDSAEHVIFALAAAVEAKDPYTEAHTQRVADAARAIGSRMSLPMSDLDALYRGGLIHDIGKIGIPDAILLKPGPLDPRELAIMQQHPMIGENIVAPLRSRARSSCSASSPRPGGSAAATRRWGSWRSPSSCSPRWSAKAGCRPTSHSRSRCSHSSRSPALRVRLTRCFATGTASSPSLGAGMSPRSRHWRLPASPS